MLPSSAFFVLSCFLALSARSQDELLVSSRFTDEVLRYDVSSGAFLGVLASGGGLDNPVGITFGPQGPRWPPKSGQSWPPENRPVVRGCPGR